MTENIVECRQLSKKYKQTFALHHVDLTIRKGEIFGLIGKNGAGKSTIMKVLAGLIHESEGNFKLFGKESWSDPFLYRRIGVLIEDAGIYPSMTAYQNLKTKALAYGYYQESNLKEILDICGLDSKSKKKAKSFSLGMKQRLGLALALLGNPELLILDEPLNGMDPQGINEMRKALKRLNVEKQTTILLSSHILEELSKIATSYAILKDGKLVQQLSAEELELQSQQYYCLKIDDEKKSAIVLEQDCGITNYKVLKKGCIHLYGKHDVSEIVWKLAEKKIRIYEITENKENLEDYFLSVSGGDGYVK